MRGWHRRSPTADATCRGSVRCACPVAPASPARPVCRRRNERRRLPPAGCRSGRLPGSGSTTASRAAATAQLAAGLAADAVDEPVGAARRRSQGTDALTAVLLTSQVSRQPIPLAAGYPAALLQLRHSWHLRLKRRLTESPVNRVRPGPVKPPPREDGYNRMVRNLPLCPSLTKFCPISWKG